MKLYSTKEAAIYLGLCVGSIKYHVYQTKLLRPQKTGNRLVFTQAQLDAYVNLPTYPPPDPDRVKNERYSSAYARWRKAVKKRDNHTCQACGDDNPTNLLAHHIKSWAKYPDLRFDVDNGLTLCKDCHHLQHYPFKHWERQAAAQALTLALAAI